MGRRDARTAHVDATIEGRPTTDGTESCASPRVVRASRREGRSDGSDDDGRAKTRAPDDGCRTRDGGGALVALGPSRGRSVSASVSAFDTIKTLVGKLQAQELEQHHPESTNAHTLAEAARDHGDGRAHIIAELRITTKTTDDWNDMNTDYAADVRKWLKAGIPVSTADRITTVKIREDDIVAITPNPLSDIAGRSPKRKATQASWKRCAKSSKRRCGRGRIPRRAQILELAAQKENHQRCQTSSTSQSAPHQGSVGRRRRHDHR